MTICSMLRAFDVWCLCPDNMDRRITNFSDSSCNDISSYRCLRHCFNIIPGSQTAICFGLIGFKSRLLFIYRFTVSCFLNVIPFVLFNNDDEVDRTVTTDE